MDRFTVALMVYAYTVGVLCALLALLIVTQAITDRLRSRVGSRPAPTRGVLAAESNEAQSEALAAETTVNDTAPASR